MRKVVLSLALLLPFLVLFAGCGGDDTVAPNSELTDPPDKVFFNGSSGKVRFSGTAFDNFFVDTVQISFDNGTNWKTATVTGTGGSVTWTYSAAETDLNANDTILTKATDKNGNVETPGAGSAYTKTTSVLIGTLQTLVSGALANDVIYLSSGSGGAYGDSLTTIVLENSTDLKIMGSGYGQALTTSSFSAIDATPVTSIAASRSSARIFSVGANLTLKNLRVSGSINAVDISDLAGTVIFEDLVFEDFKAWAIYAEDTNAADSTALYISADNVMINAASTDLPNLRGGIQMGGNGGLDIDFLIKNTLVKGLKILSSGEEGGGMFVENSNGQIDSSVFSGNAVGVWFKNSSATLSSSSISGGTNANSNGVRMSGAAGLPILRRNSINSNEGYGVKVGGGITPKFFRNSISGNKWTGVLIDYTGAEAGLLNINLGDQFDLTSGFNNLTSNGNSHPLYNPNQIYVSTTTTGTVSLHIPAENNWWGLTCPSIDGCIVDDDEQGLPTPPIDFLPASSVPN